MARFRLAAGIGPGRRAIGCALDAARARRRRATFYAGAASIELYRTETANYLSNLNSAVPSLWVALRPTGSEPPYDVQAVTADPAEGEAFTEAGNDLVDTVPMPTAIAEALEAFIAEHHVERPFFKRQRDRTGPKSTGPEGKQ